MTYDQVFEKVKALFQDADVSGIQEHLAYQFNITGEGAGAFYVEVSGRQLSIQPYEYHDRDACFTCSADTLLKIAAGKADPIPAVMMGRLKVEGNIEKALKLKEFLAARKG